MLLFVPRLSAVGDLGQKLADVLDFVFSPEMDVPRACFHRVCWRRDLARLHVAAKCDPGDAQLLCCLASRVSIHSVAYATDSSVPCQENLLDGLPYTVRCNDAPSP